MNDGLTLDELARRIEEAADHLSEWRSLGLIGRAHSDTFGPDDVERARLVQALRRRGIEVAAVVRADRDEAFLARYVARFGGASGIYSLEEAARRRGMGVDTLRRLVEAAQLTDRRELLSDEDVETSAGMKLALEAGLPEEVLTELLRVYVDTLGRVAEAENRLFHFYVTSRGGRRGCAPARPSRAAASRASFPSGGQLRPIGSSRSSSLPCVISTGRRGDGRSPRTP
jgi:hypothetical protein